MKYKLTYEKFHKWLFTILSILIVILQVGKFTFLSMESIKFYTWHLMLGLIVVFMYYPFDKKHPKRFLALDWSLILLTLIIGLYIIINYEHCIVLMQSNITTPILYAFGLITTLLVLEASRRVIGLALPIISIITIIYALLGKNLPGILGHRGYSLQKVATAILSERGVYGIPIAVSADTIFFFLLFGAFLKVSNADRIFQDIAIALTGKKRGGPAKIAIIASCLFGSISGSAVANVVSTGAFTIPLMKRRGYEKHFAGGVEAVASTGGQIMPPLMGAAAFVLADIVGVPYSEVIRAALLPALMYYLLLFKAVDLEAVKHNLKGIPADQLPDIKRSFKNGFKLFAPLGILLFFLLGLNTTPQIAAIWGTFTIVVCSFFDRNAPFSFEKMMEGFLQTVKSIPQIVAACACAGIVVGMFALTGIGLKFADFIVTLGGSNVWLCLIFGMLVCLILGMGLPTTASYIICAAAVTPAYIKLGILALPAHLFVLYYACLSAITPPVAVASYAAAGIAEENPFKVSLTAVKLGIAGFILPYIFVFNNEYINLGFDITTFLTLISAFVACHAAAIAMQGYEEQKITFFKRILYVIVVYTAIQTDMLMSIIGCLLFIVLYYGANWQRCKIRNK